MNNKRPLHTKLNTRDRKQMMVYEKRKKRFKDKGILDEFGNVQEMLLFHGTSLSSVEGILAKNFLIDAIPQQVNAKSQQRMKAMIFGKGVYFSEYPAVSMMYGEVLLLCKVMPGRCESFRPSNYLALIFSVLLAPKIPILKSNMFQVAVRRMRSMDRLTS